MQCTGKRKKDEEQCTNNALVKYGYNRCHLHLEGEQKIKYKQIRQEEKDRTAFEREKKGLKNVLTKKELKDIVEKQDKEIELLNLKIDTLMEVFNRMKM